MDQDLACSTVTAASGEPLAGTAPLINHLVAVTLPLPWPPRILDHPLLAGLDSSGMTVVGLVGERNANHTILSFWSAAARAAESPSPLGPFSRHETDCPSSSLVATIEALDPVKHVASSKEDPIDLLICTHGSRDRCCGHSGTLLHVEILAAAPTGVRVWRSSHLGGHRFAPTTLALPDGLSWGFVDAKLQLSLLNQTAEGRKASTHLRGHIGAPNRQTQAADVALFAEHGWSWLTAARRSETKNGDGSTTVSLVQDTTPDRHQVHVTELSSIAIPPCGEPITSSTKSFVPLKVSLTPLAD